MKVGVIGGRVGQDATVAYTPAGHATAKFSIAAQRFGKDKDGENLAPLWVKATIWGERAEKLGQYIKKGSYVVVTGEIDLNTWTGKDGADHTELTVNVDKFDFGGGKNESGSSAPAPAQKAEPSPSTITDEDIPF